MTDTINSEDIRTQLRTFIQERFAIPKDDADFSDDVDLFNYGYIDSLGAIEVSHFVEKQFGIKFADIDWIKNPLNSIREIALFIANQHHGDS